MKISTFNPMILSKNAEEIIKLFEELGFEKKHQNDNIDNKDITSVRMTDANGFHVDVAKIHDRDKDITTMRMNVDDYDEAYEFLKGKGFKNASGEDRAVESKSAKSCLLISPSGFSIQLTQHLK